MRDLMSSDAVLALQLNRLCSKWCRVPSAGTVKHFHQHIYTSSLSSHCLRATLEHLSPKSRCLHTAVASTYLTDVAAVFQCRRRPLDEL